LTLNLNSWAVPPKHLEKELGNVYTIFRVTEGDWGQKRTVNVRKKGIPGNRS